MRAGGFSYPLKITGVQGSFCAAVHTKYRSRPVFHKELQAFFSDPTIRSMKFNFIWGGVAILLLVPVQLFVPEIWQSAAMLGIMALFVAAQIDLNARGEQELTEEWTRDRPKERGLLFPLPSALEAHRKSRRFFLFVLIVVAAEAGAYAMIALQAT